MINFYQKHITQALCILSIFCGTHKLSAGGPAAANDPHYYYGIMLSNAQTAHDPHEQMEQFLAGSWNLLPEYSDRDKRDKKRRADQFASKYGKNLTDIKLVLPENAQKQLCGTICQETCNVQLSEAKEKHIQDLQASLKEAAGKFSKSQLNLLVKYDAYLARKKSKTEQDIESVINRLIEAWQSTQEAAENLRLELVSVSGIKDFPPLRIKNGNNIQATVEQLKSLAGS